MEMVGLGMAKLSLWTDLNELSSSYAAKNLSAHWKQVSRYQTPKVLLIKKGFKGAILQIQDKYLLGEIQGLLNFPVVQTLVQITIFKQ